jgi:hypothetical protein
MAAGPIPGAAPVDPGQRPPPLTSASDRIKMRDRYETLRSALKLERATWDSHYKLLADFFVPRRPRFMVTDRNKGDRRNQHLIDATGRMAVRTLQAGLHAGLTSPARPWMKLSTPSPDLNKRPAVKQWLFDVRDRMLSVFELSNVYNALPLLYGDLGVFGTSAMTILEDDHDLFRAFVPPIGSYAIATDAQGRVNTYCYDTILSVRQLVMEYAGLSPYRPHDPIDWSMFSTHVKDLWDRGVYEAPIEVSWIVEPNVDQDASRVDYLAMPYRSCHFERGAPVAHGRLLREGGFQQFPVMCPRWDVTGNDYYGTDCPGMTALGDVMGLQTMQRKKGQAVEKLINPPVMAPTHLRTQKTSLLPGDITYVDVREGQQGIKPVHEIRMTLQDFRQDILQTQAIVQQAFFVDLFRMMTQLDERGGVQPITAAEVNERREEKLLALGPVLERTNDELLDPFIDRVFALMARHEGMIPPAPPELAGVQLRVEYTSIMAQAQKLVGVVALDRFLQATGSMAGIWPEATLKVKPFTAVDEYQDALGVDPDLVRTDEEAGAIMDARQKAQQQAQAPESLQRTAAGVKSLAQAPTGGPNNESALSQLLAGVQGAPGGSGPAPA